MVGKRAVKSEPIIEFIVARLPTLQIWGEKKVIPSLKFNTPGQYPFLVTKIIND